MSDPVAAPGPRLKAERERRNLSLQKAGDELHLDAYVIEALESEDYARIGPSVYVKGHLKRYAELMGLPVSEIMAGYQSRAQAPAAPAPQPANVRMPTSAAPPVSNLPWPQVAGLAVGVLLLLGLLWWKPWHQRALAPPSGARGDTLRDVAAEPRPQGTTANPPVPAQLPPAVASSVPRAANAGAPAAPVSAPDADAGLGVGRARLRLSFSADSWVDVHDADGHRAFAGNGRANSVKTIAGSAPMRVYLGFASGVQLEINNRAVAIGPQFMAGNVARFEAGADGVLRRDPRPTTPPSAQTHNVRPTG
jgi:cytoskeleton protein RodZ